MYLYFSCQCREQQLVHLKESKSKTISIKAVQSPSLANFTPREVPFHDLARNREGRASWMYVFSNLISRIYSTDFIDKRSYKHSRLNSDQLCWLVEDKNDFVPLENCRVQTERTDFIGKEFQFSSSLSVWRMQGKHIASVYLKTFVFFTLISSPYILWSVFPLAILLNKIWATFSLQ